MCLDPGTKLGSYEVRALLGLGGMGEVYRARDEKLGRDVAIKLLPFGVASDAERLSRFRREAQVLASLNHPNIAAIYGLEETGGRPILVMELVEGETLAERIGRGPIPWDEAAQIFIQMAQALEAAHEKRIIHRDLKPSNVMIDAEDRVKILDFGLAKIMEGDAQAPESSQSPTLTKGTALGVVLGTAPYMSPEQARGKRVDRRTDIWSFGCCLFEALTGKRVFQGETMTDTLAAVVKSPPDFSRLPRETPASVRRLLNRALTKDPARRLRDAGDVMLELELEGSELHSAEPETFRHRLPWRASLTAALVLGALSGAAATGWLLSGSDAGPISSRRLSVVLPPGQEIDVGPFYQLALSPDGSRLVYPATDALGESRLYLRVLSGWESTSIPGTEGATSPFFSPDGKWLGFHARGTLYKVALEGGAPIVVAPVPSGFNGGSWEDDGTITTDTAYASQGLLRISPTGGPDLLTANSAEITTEISVRAPHALPDGAGYLTESFTGEDVYHLGVVDRRSGAWRSILRGGSLLSRARYVEPGYVVYSEPGSGSILAVPFDIRRLRTTGSPTVLAENVLSHYDGVLYDVSRNGTLAYVQGGTGGYSSRIVYVGRGGNVAPVSEESGHFQDPRVSRDGRSLAVVDGIALTTWIYDLAAGGRRPLSRERITMPVWSPEGTEIVFARPMIEGRGLMSKSLSTDDPIETVLDSTLSTWPTTWSEAGIGFYEQHPVNGRDVYVKPEASAPVLVAGTRANERSPWFSPDGRHLAYVSDESGRPCVYVQPFPPTGEQWLVTPKGGEEPVWSRDGKDLFYRRGHLMFAVPVTRTNDNILFGEPEELFEGRFEVTTGGRNQNYDVTPDGRFIMIQRVDNVIPREIRIVLNWNDDLKRLEGLP